MNKRKRIAPNVIRGGVAIPLGSNYFLMKGRTHREGGIDVGKDLEVEDGELMKVTKNNIKVLSDQPIFNGISPAEYAINGNVRKRFEKAFRAQEKYKNRNGLNDDGTKKAKYGTNKKSIGGDENNSDIKLGEVPGALYDGNVKEETFYKKTLPPAPYKPRQESYYYERIPNTIFKKKVYTGMPSGFVDITDDVKNGETYLHTYPFRAIYQDPTNNKYYADKYPAKGEVDLSAFTKYDLDQFKKLLPKRDYIGGSKKDVGIKVINKIPKLKETILNLSKQYGISPDVFTQRLSYEGWLQQIALHYNRASVAEQKTFPWQDYMDNEVSGFGQLGLDTFGDHLKAGDLNLRRDFEYKDTYQTNEDGTGNIYNSGTFNNAYDALEAKAAMLEYFTNIAKKRNISEEDINAYVNAMYNMGEGNDNLKNMDYVRRKYSVDKYFKLGGKMNIKNVSSTGKRTKAEMGIMKVDQHGNLIADIEPAVVTGEKRNIIREMIISELLKDSLKLKRDKTVKTNKIKAELGTQTKPKESIAEIVKRITKESQAASNNKVIELSKVVVQDAKKEMPKITAKATTADPGIIKVQNTNNKPKLLPKLDSSNLTKKAVVGELKVNKETKPVELPPVTVTDSKKEMPKITSKAVTKDPGIIIPKKEQSTNTNTLPKIDSSSLTSKAVTKDPAISKPKVQNNKEYLQQKLEEESVLKAKDDTKLQSTITKQSDVVDDDEEVVKTVKTGDKVSFFQANPTFIPNLVSAGINVAGSLISHNINKKFLNSLEEPKAPYLLQPTKLKTRINVKPQVDELRRTVRRYNKYFDKNTASSQTAVGRRLNNEQIFIDAFNQIKGNQENQETSLINQDRTQQHETAKFNLTNYNQWLRDKTNFKNTILEKKAENNTAIVQNIAGSATNFIDKENQWKRDMMTIAAISAGNPNVSADQLANLGLPYAKYMAQRRKNR